MWQPQDNYAVGDADVYDTLDEAVKQLRYAFDGVDPELASTDTLRRTLVRIEQAIELLKTPA